MEKTEWSLLAILMGLLMGAGAQSTGVSHPATDDLGRTLPTHEEVGDLRPGKTVAIFYNTWHSSFAASHKNYDLSKIITDPAMINDYNHPNWSPYNDGSYFFWGESIFDFYNGKDKWVIRKQLEILGAAGVDVLIFDATNGSFTWKAGYDAVAETMAEARADGVDVPQFAFMLNLSARPDTAASLVQLYDDIYSLDKYKDSWFIWGGKPCIMAYPESMYQTPLTSGTSQSAVRIQSGQTAGMKFHADSAFRGIGPECPSWGNNIGSLTLSLYTWNGSYASSVAQAPLASQTFVDFNDNANLNMEFSELPIGDYVWELSGATEVVGVWKYPENTSAVTSYFNGSAVSGDYKTQIGIPLAGYDPVKLDAISSFFTFRPGQASLQSGPARNDQWGWLENTPQNGYVEKSPGEYELMTVGIAQNWSEQTDSLSAMNGPLIRGRSYTTTDGFGLLTTNSHLHGYNFQEQWDRALLVDPDIIFINGWNEWVAGRNEFLFGVSNAIPDQFSPEYSRDIEPMKGGHGDNYYYQMISNIRKFKGMEKPGGASPEKTISIDGTFSDWTGVKPDFKASKGNVQLRDGYGYVDQDHPGENLHYVNNSARNDIVEAKVARDSDFVYFQVKAASGLTPRTDSNWMQLLIDIDRNKATGWEGYDLMVDRYAANGLAILSQSSNAWNWTTVTNVEFAVSGAELEIAIPRNLVDSSGGESLDLEFKWLDNYSQSGETTDFYTEGDAAPIGRFNYRYSGSAFGVLFHDTFNASSSVWDNLNTELTARQAGGVASTYTLGSSNGQTLIGPNAAVGSFPDPVLARINTVGGGGGDSILDLDTDFGMQLTNKVWSLSYKGLLLSNVGHVGWTGFAAGNPANTSGFAFNLFSDGAFQVWTNGTLVTHVTDPYPMAGIFYTLTATFDEGANTVQLTYSDASSGDYDMGTYLTGFKDASRFVELRNHVDSSSSDGIVDMRWDDLTIEVLSFAELTFAKWAEGHGLSGTDALRGSDPDMDEMDNFTEYVLGGNPNIDDAATVLPTSAFSGDWGTYVYSRRRDAAVRGLIYGMAYKLDLLDTNDWIYVGSAWETATNYIDPSFEAVTNEIPITGQDQGFYHLEVREN